MKTERYPKSHLDTSQILHLSLQSFPRGLNFLFYICCVQNLVFGMWKKWELDNSFTTFMKQVQQIKLTFKKVIMVGQNETRRHVNRQSHTMIQSNCLVGLNSHEERLCLLLILFLLVNIFSIYLSKKCERIWNNLLTS